jgi:hypothetical protein
MELYEGPRREELREYAGMMNCYPKHIVSTTSKNRSNGTLSY